MFDKIAKIKAREIISGAALPAVESTVITEKGYTGRAYVPRGTSVGKYEVKYIFDGDKRFNGAGVKTAVKNIDKFIAPEIEGMDIIEQRAIDHKMIDIDGTKYKDNIGANAILSVSLAVAKAGAKAINLPLYRYLGGIRPVNLPVPVSTIIEGGEHANTDLDFEDYLLIPVCFDSFASSLRALIETYHILGDISGKKGFVSNHGAYNLRGVNDNCQVFDIIMEAVEKAGYKERMYLGLDMVGQSLYNEENEYYEIENKKMSTEDVTAYLNNLKQDYPLIYIEDPFHEDDFPGFSKMTSVFSDLYIVGDDLFATNVNRLKKGVKRKAANTLLLKVNQIGTVSEAYEAGLFAQKNNMKVVVSVRSKDNNDSFIADLAVALGAPLAKFGPPIRTERTSKYNRLCEIEASTETTFTGESILEKRHLF